MSIDHLLPDLWTHHLALVAALLIVIFAVAVVVRRSMRGCAAVSRNDIETRAWLYCPKCGWRRGEQDTIDHTVEARCLPSALLRRGWCREPALDAEGRIVIPGDPVAVAWSLWGAMDHAFQPGSSQWRSCVEHLDRTLRTRYGDTIGGRPMTVQRWNRDPSRTKAEVIGVMLVVERYVMSSSASEPPR